MNKRAKNCGFTNGVLSHQTTIDDKVVCNLTSAKKADKSTSKYFNCQNYGSLVQIGEEYYHLCTCKDKPEYKKSIYK